MQTLAFYFSQEIIFLETVQLRMVEEYYSTLTFNGDSIFRNNSVEGSGRGISAHYSTLNSYSWG